MNKFPDVRIATVEYAETLLPLFRELHKENGLFDLDEMAIMELLVDVFDNKRGIIGVIGEPDKIKGCLCVVCQNLWYSRTVFVNELFNYVHKDHRRSDYAKQLIYFGKAAARELEMKLLVGILSNERLEAKCRLYGRMLTKVGEYFLYDPSKDDEVKD